MARRLTAAGRRLVDAVSTAAAVSCAAIALDKAADMVGGYFDVDLSVARAKMQEGPGFLTVAAAAGAGRRPVATTGQAIHVCIG